ncbi:MAG: hypothetical protein HDS01_04470 [Bacteroides sp.]|nr:hypothetical protein [Bacteroides sp.]
MLADRISDFMSLTGQSLKSAVKLVLQSRRATITRDDRKGRPLLILGNGPSLAANISGDMDILRSHDTLAVNFAANTDDFFEIRSRYYLLMDPYYFTPDNPDPNVKRLFDRLNRLVTWDMTLFIPVGRNKDVLGIDNPRIRIERFNPVGVEGFAWLEHLAIRCRRGLPRPRNVLVPAIMVGIWLGYKDIYLLGADHSWLRTLDVDDDNHVISVQPHFYADGEEEHKRVATLFRDTRLHELLGSFTMAFRSYHGIRRYVDTSDVNIYNATPGSYIDAFPRRRIDSLR